MMTTDDSWYFTETINAWTILGPLFIIYLLILALRMKKKGERYTKFQTITLVTLGIYMLSVIGLTTFPIEVNLGMYRNQSPWYSRINPIPILTIDLITFVLNIIMLIPFGVYQWLVAKEDQLSWKGVAIRSLMFSVCIELSQLLLYITLNSARSVDINDVIANTLGGVIGYFAIKYILKIKFFRKLIEPFKLPNKSMINHV